MPTFSFRRLRSVFPGLRLLLFVGLLASPLAAQTPESIALLKISLYRQSSAAATPFGFGAGTVVSFVQPVAGTGTLHTPVGPKIIPRDTSRTFSLFEAFFSRDALDAQYPSGNYTVQLEGAVNASYPLSLTATPPNPPTVTNYAEAQTIADPARFTLHWGAFEGATPLDFVAVSIESEDGQFTYSSPDPGQAGVLAGNSTSLELNLPPDKRFTGEVTFLRSSQVSTSSGTITYVGWAAVTQFALRTLGAVNVPGPVISAHPAALTVAVGSPATFNVAATGGGTLTYQWRVNGAPISGATTNTLTLPSVQAFQAGSYSVVVTNSGGAVVSAAATLTVTNPPVPDNDTRLANLSTRGQAGTDEDSLIAGFVITGTGTKRVLIRAIGPALEQFGLSSDELVADPMVTLVSAATGATVATSDDWSTSAEASAIVAATTGAGGFALPNGSRDAALLVTLPPGGYTALVAGKTPSLGVAIVEVYDLDSAPSTARLVNIATRGVVGNGSRILIPGFVVTGTQPKTYVIRGVGPGLAAFNQTNVLPDPVLTVYQGNTILFTNDDWANNPSAGELVLASRRAGAFEIGPGSLDSALLVTLQPGAYTFQLAGKGNATGIALVEVYEVP